MADYIGMCRSTWFKIKDYDKFMQGLEKVVLEDVEIEQDETDKNKITIYGYSSIPNLKETEDGDNYEDFDFMEYIQQHIAENEKMRITEIGYEKLRYLTAVAYDITISEIKIADASVY